jgi:rubrerythrin
MSEIEKVLGAVKEAIEIERFGYDFYNSMREFVKDGNGQKLVSYLAGLEVDHIVWLEEEYRRQLEKLDELREEPEVKISLLGKEEIFFGQDKLPEIFKEFDPVKAVSYAIGIENKSVAFYEKSMDISEDDKTKDLFIRLADFERDHIIILEENLKSLQEIGQWRGSSIKKSK